MQALQKTRLLVVVVVHGEEIPSNWPPKLANQHLGIIVQLLPIPPAAACVM